MTDHNHLRFMTLAFKEALKAEARGEVPIGAVLVDHITGDIIAKDGNRTLQLSDPTAHAEMMVLRKAGKKLQAQRFTGCDLYVTLEPCPMCAQAISFARLKHIYYAAPDPKGGGICQGPKIFSQSTCFHRPKIHAGLLQDECRALLKSFFRAKRIKISKTVKHEK